MSKTSLNAVKVAKIVSEKIRNGEKVVLSEAVKQAGYSRSVQRSPHQVTSTDAYKVAFALENKQIVEGIDKELARLQVAMSKKDLDKEEYKVQIQATDTLIKNKQLLSGHATANVGIAISISEHIANKYSETITEQDKDSKDTPQNGST
jgi:ribosomal protein L31E